VKDQTWIDAPPEYNGPQILKFWTCMNCCRPHTITAADKACGIIDIDRCGCGANFYSPNPLTSAGDKE